MHDNMYISDAQMKKFNKQLAAFHEDRLRRESKDRRVRKAYYVDLFFKLLGYKPTNITRFAVDRIHLYVLKMICDKMQYAMINHEIKKWHLEACQHDLKVANDQLYALLIDNARLNIENANFMTLMR
jgi:hypothetical protein